MKVTIEFYIFQLLVLGFTFQLQQIILSFWNKFAPKTTIFQSKKEKVIVEFLVFELV